MARPAGPPPADEQVDHVRLASASFSTLIRVRSSTAFSTVKTSGGEPCGVHQRQRDALDDDRDVVGVRDQPIRAARDARAHRG